MILRGVTLLINIKQLNCYVVLYFCFYCCWLLGRYCAISVAFYNTCVLQNVDHPLLAASLIVISGHLLC